MPPEVLIAIITGVAGLLTATVPIIVKQIIRSLENSGKRLVHFKCRHCGNFINEKSRKLHKCKRHKNLYLCPRCHKCKKCKGKRQFPQPMPQPGSPSYLGSIRDMM